MRKKRLWTIHFIPHNRGKVKSFNMRIWPFVCALLFVIAVVSTYMAVTSWTSYHLWHEKHRLEEQSQQLYLEGKQIEEQNQLLIDQLGNLTSEIQSLYQEVSELYEWLDGVEQIEEVLRELEGEILDLAPSSFQGLLDSKKVATLNHDNYTYDDYYWVYIDAEKPGSVRLSSLLAETQPAAIQQLTRLPSINKVEALPTLALESISEVREAIMVTKGRIENIISDSADRQQELIEIREQIELELYEAQYVPSISPSQGRISSPFGFRRDPFTGTRRMHQGIDFADSFRSPIYATAHGEVIFAARNGGYGNHIQIDHGNGYVTTYSHLTSFDVKVGDKVEKGDMIGRMGSTGRSTGVHLHYEIHKDGNSINPSPYLRGGK